MWMATLVGIIFTEGQSLSSNEKLLKVLDSESQRGQSELGVCLELVNEVLKSRRKLSLIDTAVLLYQRHNLVLSRQISLSQV